MKTFLKKILPWHVRRALAHARRFYGLRKPPFQGVYERFSDVPASSPVVDEAWRSAAWTETARRGAEQARASMGAAFPENIPPSRALLPTLVAGFLAGRPGPLRILDFGGAAGQDYAHLRASLAGLETELRYHVVDVPESCEVGRRLWKDDARVSFS